MRTRAVDHNQVAERVVAYLHEQILKNPDRHQVYLHVEVAGALGIESRQVSASLAHAGVRKITVEVWLGIAPRFGS